MSPPLRPQESLDELWLGLRDGDVQTVGTDHCPFNFKGQKDMSGKDDYKVIPNGAPGIETMLMLMHTEGVVKGRITLERMVDVVSTSTARMFGLANKGAIAAGKDADIVVFDPKKKFTITQKKLHQNVDYTPWEGWEMTGMPQIVYSRGRKVAEWSGDQVKFVGEAAKGRFVKRAPLAAFCRALDTTTELGYATGNHTGEGMNTQELQALDREHVIYSWKAQGGWKPTVIDHAEGVYMYDTDGKKILDGCSGLLNINLGHGNRHVLDAMKAQMEKLCFVSPGFGTEPKAKLASMVAEVTPGDLDYVLFTNGGAEANENAIKSARWFTGRHKIYAAWKSYHGATAGAITLTGDPAALARGAGHPRRRALLRTVPVPLHVGHHGSRGVREAHAGRAQRAAHVRQPEVGGGHHRSSRSSEPTASSSRRRAT